MFEKKIFKEILVTAGNRKNENKSLRTDFQAEKRDILKNVLGLFSQ